MLKIGLGEAYSWLISQYYRAYKVVGDKFIKEILKNIDPLSKFGAKFKLKNTNFLPLKIYGSNKLRSIKYIENKGSAQCKSSVFLQNENRWNDSN